MEASPWLRKPAPLPNPCMPGCCGGGCGGGVRRYVISSTHFVRYSFDFSRKPSRSTSGRNSESTSRKELWCLFWAVDGQRELQTQQCGVEVSRRTFGAALLPGTSFLSSAVCASPPVLPFARSRVNACSSMRMCLFSWSFSFFALRTSPSCFAILAFISARSMSQAFRARSWLCHSSCRKRITPAAVLAVLHGPVSCAPCASRACVHRRCPTLQCVFCACWRTAISGAIRSACVHGRRRLPRHGGSALRCWAGVLSGRWGRGMRRRGSATKRGANVEARDGRSGRRSGAR